MFFSKKLVFSHFSLKTRFYRKMTKNDEKGAKRAQKRALGTPKKGYPDVRWGAVLVGSLIIYKKPSKKAIKTGFCFAAYGEKNRCFLTFFPFFLGGPKKPIKSPKNVFFAVFIKK